jgi:DNA invertase Pin-like site-specific DNA recombinase
MIRDESPNLAYSYERFSEPPQGEGDSTRRQDDLVDAWCQRNGKRLDKTTRLWEPGTSAWKGRHLKDPEKNPLARFVQLVRQKKIPRGTFLIVENLDRLSRMLPVRAMRLLVELLDEGVNVVALTPVETVYTPESRGHLLMMAALEFERANGESNRKSTTVGPAWQTRKRRARENGETLTRRFPAWVEERDGQRVEIADRAKTVRLLFDLSIRGYGSAATVAYLNRNRIPCFGASSKWNTKYIGSILTDRRALGECQPRGQDGKPDGPKLEGYFPTVVSADTFHRSQAARLARGSARGRHGVVVNLFVGLVVEARSGSPYLETGRTAGVTRCRMLRTYGSMNANEAGHNMRADVFESCILGRLRELPPADVLGPSNVAGEARALSDKITATKASLATKATLLDAAPSLTLACQVKALEEELGALLDAGQALAGRAASSVADAWEEAPRLIDMIESADDKHGARLALRATLHRMVAEIRLLVVARGPHRLAVAQLWFVEGARTRMYLMRYRAAVGRAPGPWIVPPTVRSYPDENDIDLRRPADVLAVEANLNAVPLT